jgi:hypothetical protein
MKVKIKDALKSAKHKGRGCGWHHTKSTIAKLRKKAKKDGNTKTLLLTSNSIN